ncbi:hypothetical protein [Halostagnicola kamekurae]|uniref:DUF8076 domain-containing protein n=1 Tax=Halostagnicola kamekurae TaxID=619731 RepID=A0A1I6UTA0_9EURY|nr:hypothetical protein [Halostagnicola kamekurae]SFT04626.1 hypothetical protein SAMN04488556_4074 [Halostagnicola kamekurae]
MAGSGQIPGQYNIVIEGKYDTFDHQIPVEQFIECLEDNVPDKVSVVRLGDVFADGDQAIELARAMDRRANDLEYQSPTVQFVVEGSFHRRGKTYDLRYNDELYPLQGSSAHSSTKKEGDWLVAPF